MEQDQSVAAPESANPEAGAVASSVDPTNATAEANVYSQNSATASVDTQYPDSAVDGGSAALSYNGAQGADGSVYPTDHASLNGTAGQNASYQAAEHGAAAAEMGEPMAPEQSYEDGNCWGKISLCISVSVHAVLLLLICCLLFCSCGFGGRG